MSELQTEIPSIQEQIEKQRSQLETVHSTVLVLNTQCKTLLKTIGAVDALLSVLQVDYAHTQLVIMHMSEMLQGIGSSVDSWAMGSIPPYLVLLSLVQDICH